MLCVGVSAENDLSNDFWLFYLEILQDPSVSSKLSDTKASGEVKALDDFYQMLQNDPNRAFYGYVVNQVL